jgi:hypothetical protein
MKHGIRIWIVGLLTMAIAGLVVAQSVSVKRLAVSPGDRSSGFPNFTSPPTGTPNYVSPGLRTVAKGMKVYFKADTAGSGATKVTSYSWTFASRPGGSTAAFGDPAKDSVAFIPDVAGQYIVQVSVNGGAKTTFDTVFASTYRGITTLQNSCVCHSSVTAFTTSYNNWKSSKHATIFARGITGQLENAEGTNFKGAYSKSCFRCHTTGWESVTNNGNFGFLANQGATTSPPTSLDSTWWKGFATSGSDYLIPYKDSTVYKMLTPQQLAVGNIGCEMCHGPAQDHATTGDKTKITISPDGGACTQCHESPKGHSIGYFWSESNHATMKTSSAEASNRSCWPCHNGSSFIAFTKAWSAGRATASADSAKVDLNFKSISCATCHEPHGNSSESWIRYAKIDTLMNGYKVATGLGGKGQLCMNCHRGRADYSATVKTQFGRFNDRFYPHYSSQTDMYFGTQGWEFGLNLKGLNTHTGVKDGCVTCHMAERTIVPGYTKSQADHNTSMSENGVDKVEGCVDCHGSITSFNDIKALYDYDMDGKIEGAVDEVAGLMAQLKAKLPLDATGEPVTMRADSMIVRNFAASRGVNYQTLIGSLWNYNYVSHDMSGGVHNTKYAVALLRASLGTITGVAIDPVPMPTTYVLNQNYPNPFNPNTQISFSIPKESHVNLQVYDMMGRVVATLVDEVLPAGTHAKVWNGRTSDGRVMASGIYFYTIKAEGYIATKKMMLLK